MIAIEASPYHAAHYNAEKWTYSKLSLTNFQGIAISIFAYNCHTGIFMLKDELSKPTLDGMNKVKII